MSVLAQHEAAAALDQEYVDPRQAVLDAPKGFRVDVGAHECSMRDVHNPELARLIKHAERWGPDGILEAGMHLNDTEFLLLRDVCSKLRAS